MIDAGLVFGVWYRPTTRDGRRFVTQTSMVLRSPLLPERILRVLKKEGADNKVFGKQVISARIHQAPEAFVFQGLTRLGALGFSVHPGQNGPAPVEHTIAES